MDAAGIASRIRQAFGDDAIGHADLEAPDPCVTLPAALVGPAARLLRDDPELAFDSCLLLSSVDLKDRLQVVYHLFSMRHRHGFVFKVDLPREAPRVASVEGMWRGAGWHEREAYDMMGIVFEGNGDLRRILCPDDWEGWPLRKDYEQPEFYRGMRVRPTEQMVDEARKVAGGIGGYGKGPFE